MSSSRIIELKKNNNNSNQYESDVWQELFHKLI